MEIIKTRAKNLTCAVCDGEAGRWVQYWNQDKGYGVCRKCVNWLRSRGTQEDDIAEMYGKENFNWG